jgi:hypothetical protein
VGRPRRRGAVRGSSVEGLASRIPSMLRTFAPSTDPQTFREHLGAISAMVGDGLVHAVMSVAGLSASDWYRQALAQEPRPRDHTRPRTFVDSEGNERPILKVVE